MSNAQEINISALKLKLWQPDLSSEQTVEPVAKTAPPVSEFAVQERQGTTGDLQNFLGKSLLKFNGNEGFWNPHFNPFDPKVPPIPDINKIKPPTPPLFSKGGDDINDVDYNDIKQGNYGDCYLLASVAAIAKSNPEQIHNMVRENKDADGNVTSYTVTFYKKDHGFLVRELAAVTKVEAQVKPSEVFKDGANPADNGEIWVKVIETGYAKFKGGVDKIKNGGYPQDTLEELTGKDSTTVDPQSGFDMLLYPAARMQMDLGMGKDIVLSSKSDDKTYGIHGSHAYMVQNVYTDANGNKMVQLYNPWGFDHPKPIPYDQLGKYFHTISVN